MLTVHLSSFRSSNLDEEKGKIKINFTIRHYIDFIFTISALDNGVVKVSKKIFRI